MAINKLILGDCLEVLKTLENETVDLIYIDPPFFSNRTYEVIWGDKGEIRSFEDRFSGGIEHYISWLKERIQEMHRILKPTGSIFVHCDWHADAYIKVSILDKVFGTQNFKNEIIWCYKTRANSTSRFNRKHDNIYFYSKTDAFVFKSLEVREELSEVTILKYRLIDEQGRRYRLCGRGIAGSPIKSAKDVEAKWEQTNPEWTIRVYLDERLGMTAPDYWEIDIINQQSKERIGYPTQKPEKLLERIIKCASNEGDIILDCFVGGGTTIAVADKLNRHWIGIDQSVNAVKVTEFRLNKQQNLFSKPFSVQLHKYDYDTLRNKDAFEFETWIVGQFGGLSNSKQRGDLGLDGRTRENQAIQVKRSDNVGRNVIDNFFSAVQRFDKVSFEKHKLENKPVGFICWIYYCIFVWKRCYRRNSKT
ncbi:MAG: hypothetical protein EAZ06_03505 [Cytophagales bacterium]|nr:MAG: hypothetical protein EAZ06_03505 [Cytophagales bacterium]